MYVAPDRFDEPLTTEGYHARRANDLEDDPISGVGGVVGSLSIIAFSEGEGMTYEQTEPIGDNHHRYKARSWPKGSVRPA